MVLEGVELETLVSEPDALTTRPLPCAIFFGFTRSVLALESSNQLATSFLVLSTVWWQ